MSGTSGQMGLGISQMGTGSVRDSYERPEFTRQNTHTIQHKHRRSSLGGDSEQLRAELGTANSSTFTLDTLDSLDTTGTSSSEDAFGNGNNINGLNGNADYLVQQKGGALSLGLGLGLGQPLTRQIAHLGGGGETGSDTNRYANESNNNLLSHLHSSSSSSVSSSGISPGIGIPVHGKSIKQSVDDFANQAVSRSPAIPITIGSHVQSMQVSLKSEFKSKI